MSILRLAPDEGCDWRTLRSVTGSGLAGSPRRFVHVLHDETGCFGLLHPRGGGASAQGPGHHERPPGARTRPSSATAWSRSLARPKASMQTMPWAAEVGRAVFCRSATWNVARVVSLPRKWGRRLSAAVTALREHGAPQAYAALHLRERSFVRGRWAGPCAHRCPARTPWPGPPSLQSRSDMSSTKR